MPESEEPKKVSNNDLRNAQFGGGFINAENVNAGRIGGDIWNFFFGQQLAPVGKPTRPENQRLLLAQVKHEVAARLEQSLHNAVLINLRKELQQEQVKRPWDAEIKIGLKPPEPLPDNTSILEVFDKSMIAGKLLILGAPGSGKTTTMLELAQELVARAEDDSSYPIPVLFNLSSCSSDRLPLTEWLVAELNSKYGVRAKLGNEWVENHQLLPLLDGLDELESTRQESCVQAINQLLQGVCRPPYLVVCSRYEEYGNFETKLQLNGGIWLHLLTENQIHKYLADVNHANLWHFISNDHNLLELTKVPLLLSIVVLAYQEVFSNSWENMTGERWDNITAEEWSLITPSASFNLQDLLDAYVQRMLLREIDSRVYHKKKFPTPKQTRLWLIWLAQQLQRETQTEFLIEKMQPTWLETKSQASMYQIVFGLFYGLIFGFLSGFIFTDVKSGLFQGIILSLYFGLIYGSAGNWSKTIKIVDSLRWSYTIQQIGLFIILVIGIIFLGVAQQNQLNEQIIQVLTIILSCFFYGFRIGPINKNKKIPNQGIWNSAFCTMFIIFASLLGAELMSRLGGIRTVTFGGLLIGFYYGGSACIQHFTLRLILYRNGYIPWNYARFLDYCTERLLLQRVGGRYRFIHKLLQDHLAQMEFERLSDH